MQARYPYTDIVIITIDSHKISPHRNPYYPALQLSDSLYPNQFSESSSEVLIPKRIAPEEIMKIVDLKQCLRSCEDDVLGLWDHQIPQYKRFLLMLYEAFGTRKKGDKGSLRFTRPLRVRNTSFYSLSSLLSLTWGLVSRNIWRRSLNLNSLTQEWIR